MISRVHSSGTIPSPFLSPWIDTDIEHHMILEIAFRTGRKNTQDRIFILCKQYSPPPIYFR